MMLRVFAWIWESAGAAWVLTSLALRSKGNLKSSYWNWRTQTAFPDGVPKGIKPRTLIWEYARWSWRIRRLR